MIGRNVYAYLMSYWEDLDDQLSSLEPSDLNLECTGVRHLDRVSERTLASYVKAIIIDRVYIVRVRPEKEVRYFSSDSVIRFIPFTVIILITRM